MADAVEREILTLPDFDDVEAAGAFLAELEAQSTRHGVKKLLSHSEAILRYKKRLTTEVELAERALLVVNGQRTPLQALKDKTRYARSNAEKFYSTMSTNELLTLCDSIRLFTADRSRESAIEALVESYVKRRTNEIAEQYGVPVDNIV